jgi:anti-anti-sigma regulatory factor
MEIKTEQVQTPVHASIVRLAGDLDGSCYETVIEHVRKLRQAGTKNVVLDMGGVMFMSSAGLVALHQCALILRGDTLPLNEEGWNAIHAVSRFVEGSSGLERHIVLLNPSPRVQQTLQKTGFDRSLAVFSDLEAALASFPAD